MPLLESKYQAAARTELERRARELEAKDKAAQAIDPAAQDVSANISFARDTGLISEQQAEAYRKRIRAVQQERFMRTEAQERVDDIENPRERAGRYYDLEEVKAEASREREGKARAEPPREPPPRMPERADERTR